MKIIRVLPYKVWVNKSNGRTVSIRGAVPYSDLTDMANWAIEQRGFTWELDNGTYGLGRVPAKTEHEAILIMQAFNNRND